MPRRISPWLIALIIILYTLRTKSFAGFDLTFETNAAGCYNRQ